MYEAMKRHEIQVLKAAGHSTRDVVNTSGVSRSTVKRVAKEPPVETRKHGKVIKARRSAAPGANDTRDASNDPGRSLTVL